MGKRKVSTFLANEEKKRLLKSGKDKTPRRFASNASTFCFKRLDVFKKRRVLFLKDCYLLKKDGGLFGKVIPLSIRLKSWILTLHSLHRSPFYVKREGCEG